MDFTLALYPSAIIWNLNLDRKKKTGLAFLMGLGVFAGASAIVKTIQIPTLSARSDFTWQTIELFIWNVTESTAILVAGCIPTLRPLFLDMRSRLGSSRRKASNSYPMQIQTNPSNHRKPLSQASSQERILVREISKHPPAMSGTLPITRTTETTIEFNNAGFSNDRKAPMPNRGRPDNDW